ncbi:hypothetical protein Tco_1261393 [Tanacetum coccineum]
MPSFPSPEPTISCFDDLDFFKDFEKEFPAIVYNDALTSKSNFLTEPTLSPQHIDEFDLKDETSLSEYDEVEQNVFYFNDLFPFNIIYLDDLKPDKENDDNKIDITQPPGDMAPLPPRDHRHLWLQYQVEGYTKEIVHDFEDRLETIFGRQVNRVHVLDFEGLTPKMRQDLAERSRMYLRIKSEMGLDVADTLCFQLGGARRSMTWRQFILALGLHTAEEMTEDRFEAYWSGSERVIPDKGNLTFLGGDRHLKRHAEGRKSDARLSGGHFIGLLAHHFGLVSDDRLRGLSVVTHELPLIDMGELVKLNIYVDEGAQAVLAPVHAPPPPPPPPATDRFSTWMISCMTQLMEASGRTYQAFNGTFRGSYPMAFERRTRQRIDGASTSTGQQDQQQPDP